MRNFIEIIGCFLLILAGGQIGFAGVGTYYLYGGLVLESPCPLTRIDNQAPGYKALDSLQIGDLCLVLCEEEIVVEKSKTNRLLVITYDGRVGYIPADVLYIKRFSGKVFSHGSWSKYFKTEPSHKAPKAKGPWIKYSGEIIKVKNILVNGNPTDPVERWYAVNQTPDKVVWISGQYFKTREEEIVLPIGSRLVSKDLGLARKLFERIQSRGVTDTLYETFTTGDKVAFVPLTVAIGFLSDIEAKSGNYQSAQEILWNLYEQNPKILFGGGLAAAEALERIAKIRLNYQGDIEGAIDIFVRIISEFLNEKYYVYEDLSTYGDRAFWHISKLLRDGRIDTTTFINICETIDKKVPSSSVLANCRIRHVEILLSRGKTDEALSKLLSVSSDLQKVTQPYYIGWWCYPAGSALFKAANILIREDRSAELNKLLTDMLNNAFSDTMRSIVNLLNVELLDFGDAPLNRVRSEYQKLIQSGINFYHARIDPLPQFTRECQYLSAEFLMTKRLEFYKSFETNNQATVSGDYTGLYQFPLVELKPKTVLSKGTRGTVLYSNDHRYFYHFQDGDVEKWYKVNYNENIGWIKAVNVTLN